ncbi:hypothetical protein Acr_17g0012280 [Actinidia rufa]|uniref:Uncharacterized protein n=1 Tax=Actinidia rufa TaxID=165716 RepID=A0A7J0G4C9_9ERIC|nr:hypothetical protein Acr_17g0012280 [Actinidia rufa]
MATRLPLTSDHELLNFGLERPSPNDAADWVEGEGNCIFVQTWLIHQARLRFPLSQLLKKVMAFCRLTFMQVSPNQPQTRLVTDSPDKDSYLNDFIWVFGQWEFGADNPGHFMFPRFKGYIPIGRSLHAHISFYLDFFNNCGRTCKVDQLLGYIPAYHHTIPYRADIRGQPRLPPLRIYAEGESTSSSGSSSSDSSNSWDMDLGGDEEERNEDVKIEDGKEVDQISIIAPLTQIDGAEPILGGSLGFSLGEEEQVMASKVRALGKKKAMGDEPMKQPTDLVPLFQQVVATSAHLKKHTADLKRANQKICGLKKELKQTRATPALPVELSDPLMVYLLILLIDFNEDEYATLPVEGEDVNVPMAQGNELAGIESIVVEQSDGVVNEWENLIEGPSALPAISNALIKRSRLTNRSEFAKHCDPGARPAVSNALIKRATFWEMTYTTVIVQIPRGVEGVILPFRTVNSHIADKRSDAVSPVSDIADLSSVRECYCEAIIS